MNFNGFPVAIDQVITGAPAVGDIDGDGQPDIIFGSGTFFPNPATHPGSPQLRTPRLYAVKNDGTFVSGWPVTTDTFINRSPVLADLNGDGKLDVVATGVLMSASPPIYRCEAYSSNGSRLFSVLPRDFFSNSNSVFDPVVADISGDTKPEILLATSNEICILSNVGQQITNFPPHTPGAFTLQTETAATNVVVSDLNNDGVQEIIAIAAGPPPHQIDTRIFVWNLNTTVRQSPVWGAFKQHGALRRGAAPGTPVGNRARYFPAETLVAYLYRDFLQREGSPSEIQAWASLINSGQMTRAEVSLGFFNSVEYQRTYATITRYYLGLLARAPDYDGLIFWVNYLLPACNAAECAPARRQEIVNYFIASPEFTQRFGSDLTNEEFVILMYQNILKRTPSQSEIQFWANALNNGFTRGEMARQFVESDEYILFISRKDTLISSCYGSFLHRGAEPAGFAFWQAFMVPAKNSETDLIQEFITADEYLNRVNSGWQQ
jgi:hypothetical protein